jgi:hypothetical protein
VPTTSQIQLTSAPTNITTVPYTAPTAGTLLAMAGGYCNVDPGQSTSLCLETANNTMNCDTPPYNEVGAVQNNSNAFTYAPWFEMRAFKVAQGAGVIYLNGRLLGGANSNGRPNCQGNVSLLFTETPLQ